MKCRQIKVNVILMGKMVTKTKRVDGNLWYYRADVDEPEEKYNPPPPSTAGYEKGNTALNDKFSTTLQFSVNQEMECVDGMIVARKNNINGSNIVTIPTNWISASAPELLK